MINELFSLAGKTALVTGAGLGIGRAIAIGIASAGAGVYLCDIDLASMEETAAAITDLGRDVGMVTADIGDRDQIYDLFQALDQRFGRIDILVNNVGITARHRPEELPVEDLERVLDVGIIGSMLCAQQAGRRMITQGSGGSIINISSIAGTSALGRGNLAHSVNKGAIHMLTKELAVEWAKHGIRVNAILPCQVLTEGFQKWLDSPTFDPDLVDRFLQGIPMQRLATPADMVGPTVFLASDASAMVTGALLGVDGGNLALNAGGSHSWTTA